MLRRISRPIPPDAMPRPRCRNTHGLAFIPRLWCNERAERDWDFIRNAIYRPASTRKTTGKCCKRLLNLKRQGIEAKRLYKAGLQRWNLTTEPATVRR